MTQIQIVKGYICFNCADVALAQKGENPAHPPGSPSNPTGDTPNGPDPLTGPKAVDASSAVVFGGTLAGRGAAPATPTTYQVGSQLSISA